jgi:hypothetical protein
MTNPTDKQDLLLKKKNDFIKSKESVERRINYDNISTEKLLIVEALNDWSGRSLAEAGTFKITCQGNDPACATNFELNELTNKLVAGSGILYPISGFLLNDKDELRYNYTDALYLLTPHTTGSRAHGVTIAEAKHIQDVDAAVSLWAFCATEDSMAYLQYQLDDHNLWLEEEETESVRRLILSSFQGKLSIGKARNAIWRTVKAAASLSTKQFWNTGKASRTIPKKLDQKLSEISEDSSQPDYDRIEQVAMPAVLTLMLTRFGITDVMKSKDVRKIFNDSKEAGKQFAKDEEVENSNRLSGYLYYFKIFTDVDKKLLNCFEEIILETEEPVWDEKHEIGKIWYTGNKEYCVDGDLLMWVIFNALGLSMPSIKDFELMLKDEKDPTDPVVMARARKELFGLSLSIGGVSKDHVKTVLDVFFYPATPGYLSHAIWHIPMDSGLCAVRTDWSEPGEWSSRLSVSGFDLCIDEGEFEPVGSDVDVIRCAMAGDTDGIADLVATAMASKIKSGSGRPVGDLLSKVGQKLMEKALGGVG